jgi:hypothetical protein
VNSLTSNYDDFEWTEIEQESNPAQIYQLKEQHQEAADLQSRKRLLLIVCCLTSLMVLLMLIPIGSETLDPVPASVKLETGFGTAALPDGAPAISLPATSTAVTTPATSSSTTSSSTTSPSTTSPSVTGPEVAAAPETVLSTSSAGVKTSNWPAKLEQLFLALTLHHPVVLSVDQEQAVVIQPGLATEQRPELTPSRSVTPSIQQVPMVKLEHRVLDQSRRNLFTGDRNLAKMELRAFVSGYPAADKARTLLAGLLMQDEQWQLAGEYLGNVNGDSLAELKLLKARMLAQRNQLDAAIRLLEIKLPALNEAPGYHALLGAIYQRNQQYDKVVTTYAGLNEVEPDNGSWSIGLAIGLEKTGDISGALARYSRSLNDGTLPNSMRRFADAKIKQLSLR